MKKFLSLVLALVMTMSLVTISAGAKDFTDDSKITYAEAVDVISAVKVVDGYTDGSFNPTATLTRGAAAKIICNLILGPTTASALVADAAPYKDVPADSTFAGYIAFCAKEGIIDGYTDGTFRPGHSLTGYAFMKLLLGALGYDKDVEGYNGTNWSINVAKRALNLGLDDGLTENFNGVKPVTREEACLYALNTMKATMVQYDSKTTVSVGGAEVVIAGSKAEDVENKLAADNTIYADGKMQFAEKYFTNLKLDDDARDDFGRPANEWKNKTSKIGLYVQTPDLEYTEKVELGDIYADLGLSKKQTTDEYAVNGKDATAVTVSKKDDTTLGATNNGVLTQVWWDDEYEYLVVTSIETYVAEVGSVVKATDKADRYITLASKGNTPGTLNTKFETEKFDKKDLVTYTAAYNESTNKYDIKTVAALEKADTGILTEWKGSSFLSGDKGTSNSSFTANGEKYEYSLNNVIVNKDGGILSNGIADFEVDESEVNVYLDEYGYAIYVSGVEGTTNYAVVIGIGSTNQYGSETRGVTLVLPDGTQKTVTAKLATGFNWNNGGAGSYFTYDGSGKNLVDDGLADIVTYTVDDDGVYKLTPAGYMKGTDGSSVMYTGKYSTDADNANTTFLNGKSVMTIQTKANDATDFTTAGKNTYYTTSETIFVVATPKASGGYNYNVYTGYADAPGIDATALVEGMAFVCNSDYTSQIDIVYIDATRMAGISGVDTYFVKSSSAKVTTDSTGKYYTLPAIVNGEETTVKVDANATVSVGTMYKKDGTTTTSNFYEAVGLFAVDNVKKNSKGIITDFDLQNANAFRATNYIGSTPSVGTIAANKVVLGIGVKNSGETYWAYNDDTAVFVVDKDYKTITVSSVSAVNTDTDDKVYADYTTSYGNKVLTDVIILEQDPTILASTAEITGITVDGVAVTGYATVAMAKANPVEIVYDSNTANLATVAATAKDANNKAHLNTYAGSDDALTTNIYHLDDALELYQNTDYIIEIVAEAEDHTFAKSYIYYKPVKTVATTTTAITELTTTSGKLSYAGDTLVAATTCETADLAGSTLVLKVFKMTSAGWADVAVKPLAANASGVIAAHDFTIAGGTECKVEWTLTVGSQVLTGTQYITIAT